MKILENISVDSEVISNLEENTSSEFIRKFYNEIRSNRLNILTKLNDLCGLFWALTLYNRVCNLNSSIMLDSLYFRPTRGQDNRFFRSQKLEKMEILPEGENLSAFYESLGDERMDQFFKL